MDLLIGSLLLRPYVFLFMAAFFAAGARDLGLRRTLLFGAVVWPIAWAAEFSSIHVGFPFGLYHYTGLTRGRELYVAGVPFFDSLSFTFLAYAAYCLARRVLAGRTVPSATTAVLAGFFMVFIPTVGEYITPLLVGGSRSTLYGNIIELYFGAGANWPLGSAMSVVMLGGVVLLALIVSRLVDLRKMVE